MNLLSVEVAAVSVPRKADKWVAFANHKGKDVTLFPVGGKNSRLNAIKGATEFALREGYRGVMVVKG